MNAFETNRQLVLNYKKQILAVLETSCLELSNNMKNSGAVEDSRLMEKSKVSLWYCFVSEA